MLRSYSIHQLFAGFNLIGAPARHVTCSDSAFTSSIFTARARLHSCRSSVTRGVEQQLNRHPQGVGQLHGGQNRSRLETSAQSGFSLHRFFSSQEYPYNWKDQKSLSVAVIGLPNAGKSTLANRLIGHKISGVSSKRNTTIDPRLGSFTHKNVQVLLYDTPGLVDQPCQGSPVDKLRSAWSTAAMVDHLLLVVDAERQYRHQDESLLKLVRQLAEGPPGSIMDTPSWRRTPAALFLNKQDKLEKCIRSTVLEQLHQQLDSLMDFDVVICGAAMLGVRVEQLKRYLIQQAVPRPWALPGTQSFTSDPGDLAVELVRERLFRRLNQDLPYKLQVECVSARMRSVPVQALMQDQLAARPLSQHSSSRSSSCYSQHISRGDVAPVGLTPDQYPDLSVLAGIQPTPVADKQSGNGPDTPGWLHQQQQQQQPISASRHSGQQQQQQPSSASRHSGRQHPPQPTFVRADSTQVVQAGDRASSATDAAAVLVDQPWGRASSDTPAVQVAAGLSGSQMVCEVLVRVTVPNRPVKSMVVGRNGDVINTYVKDVAQEGLSQILKLPVKLSVEVCIVK